MYINGGYPAKKGPICHAKAWQVGALLAGYHQYVYTDTKGKLSHYACVIENSFQENIIVKNKFIITLFWFF